METLAVQDISVSFGDVSVLRNASMSAPAGGLTAVLGPSGCGKTTLLRVIAGLHRAHSGRVRIGDQDVTALEPRQRRISWVPQEGALFPHLTVAQNVGFGVGRSARTQVYQMLELLRITDLADRLPSEISGGQAQRAALARALVVQPRAVLLDEPFSALDATLRTAVREDVREALLTAGVTAIMVTHDQQEALSLADWVVVLHDGAVQQAGSPRELYHLPATDQVARFVGDAVVLPACFTDAGADTPLGLLELANSPVAPEGFVVVRPEQFQLSTHATARRAQVERVVFYGHDQDVQLCDSASGMTVTARVQDADVTAGSQVGYHIVGPVAVVPAPVAVG